MSDLEIPEFKFAIREDLKDTEDLFLPYRATNRSAGWDVKAAMEDRATIELKFGECAKIPLGFRTFCPEGWWYELKPRSSSFGKKNLHALYGTIDEDFEGQLIFACQYLPDPKFQLDFDGTLDSNTIRFEKSLKIGFGEAIGQIIPVRRQDMRVTSISNAEIEELYRKRNAERGAGGFGSTSK